MTLIDIYSGFLGAGKTTLIKKLIAEAYSGEKVVLIENEFGEIGVDGGFLREAGIEITEMNSGCICCSLVGDFAAALKKVKQQYDPDRIIIEPSGVGKLSDIILAVQKAELPDSKLNAFTTVVDAKKCKMYLKNFGEFFLDQVKNASCIVLSHTKGAGAKVAEAVEILKGQTNVTIVSTDWEQLTGKEILAAMEQEDSLKAELQRLAEETAARHEHHHHHHHEGEHCCHHDEDEEEHHHHHGEHCCHHDEDEEEHHHHHGEHCCHHDDDEEEHEHHHGEHCCHHDEDEEEHEHHHHYDENGVCSCGRHHDEDEEEHGHHHHHDADEVFTSWGVETAKKFTKEGLTAMLQELDTGKYGTILRAKGIVDGDGEWLYFDYVPEEYDVRTGSPIVTGRLCVIGCKLDEQALKELFIQ